MPLTATEIESSALEILDRYGLGDLSMRRIAAGLGVAPGALYWHVASKQQLLIGLARRIVGDPLPRTGPWQQRLEQWAGHLREQLLRHRDGAELVASAVALAEPVAEGQRSDQQAVASSLDLAGPARRVLLAAGFGVEDATAAADTTLHYILGQTMGWQSRLQYRSLGVTSEGAPVDRFDFGLRVIIDGLQVRLTDQSQP